MLSIVENNWKSQITSGTEVCKSKESKATMNSVGRKNSKINIIL